MNDIAIDKQNHFENWPHSEASKFINAAGYTWHIQDFGNGPVILFVHGTGASTHSWAKLATLLKNSFRVICLDLPGHGFTDMPSSGKLTLPRIAKDISYLLETIEVDPSIVIGHSAGAAILVKMSLDNLIQCKTIISINGALLPLNGIAGHLFAPAAKVLARIPFIPNLFVSRAKDPNVARRMIQQTGSSLGDEDIDRYRQLLKSRKHVNAALQMMANWQLESLGKEFSKLDANLYLLACENDKTVSMHESKRISSWSEKAQFELIPRLGHLGHEEQPEIFYQAIMRIAKKEKVLNY